MHSMPHPDFDDETIRRVDPGLFDHAVHDAFLWIVAGRLRNPPRIEQLGRPDDPDYFRLEMPAELADGDGWPWLSGSKIIEESGARDAAGARRLGRRRSLLRLHHLPTDRTVTFAAEHLTNARTASSAAQAARYLLPSPTSVAIIGTGRIAHHLAGAVDRLLQPEVLQATSRTAVRREAFAADLAGALRAELRLFADRADAVAGAEVVFAAVPADRPVLVPDELGAARVLVAVEGDPRVAMVAPELMATGPVVVDHLGQAEATGSWRAASLVTPARREGRPLTVADLATAPAIEGRPVVLLTGLAGLDLVAGLRLWQALAPAEAPRE